MRYSPRSARRVAATVATASALVLSACGSGDDSSGSTDNTGAAPPSETVTVTEEVPAEDPAGEDAAAEAPAEDAEGTEGTEDTEDGEDAEEAPPEDANCEPDPESPVITDSIENLPPPGLPDSTWVYKGDSNYNECSDLSYATVEQDPQGNAQFENRLIFFHQGQYSTTPDTANTQQHKIVDTTEDSVTVEFKDWEALDEAGGANVDAPNYTETVTFRWDGNGVTAEGRIPNEP
ncbi:MAG TPA: LppP/LprE family lipoprotein [Candidatus Corynebacterium avicola]|uniref:LppP/LprE family lipoprotein n=1 Tax=Candidatus Corynebacterium avicola TaxID=2838527 RepID=A0A9D1ULZ1_9CORY|nr:LppP/LprE family lipoprotein [Candidatus Corynebacterium avicola]